MKGDPMPPEIETENEDEGLTLDDLDAMTLQELREFQSAVDGDIKALRDKGGKDLDGLSVAEAERLTNLATWVPEVTARIEGFGGARRAVKALGGDGAAIRRPGMGRDARGDNPPADEAVKGRIDDGESEFEKFAQKGPFKSLNHQLWAIFQDARAVKASTERPAVIREWLDGLHRSESSIKAAYGDDAVKSITGMGEFIDSEGGILIAPEFAANIRRRMVEDDVYLPGLCDSRTVTGNTWIQRAYQDKSRATGSRMGGVRGYWLNEGGTITPSQPQFRGVVWRLNKIAVAIYVTEEQLEDTSGLEAENARNAADEFRFMFNDAVIRGTGNGMPLGLMSAGCKIAVASNNGAENTITGKDVDAMWARRARPSGSGYRWLGNQEIEPQIAQLNYNLGSTSVAAQWAYIPGGSFGQNGPMLKGKPIDFIEQCEALGTEGDLILWDPKEYVWVQKATGISASASFHVRFLNDERVFKWTTRVDGRSYWDAPLTRYKGGSTLSPVLTLESTRSS